MCHSCGGVTGARPPSHKFFFGGFMSKRFGISKGHSAHKFRGQIQRTKSPNINRQVMRGGWRL